MAETEFGEVTDRKYGQRRKKNRERRYPTVNQYRKYLYQPMRCVLFLLVFLLTALVTSESLNQLSRWWTVLAVCVNFVTLAILLLYCKHQNTTYFKLIGYRKGKTKPREVIFMILAVLVIGMGGMYLAGFLCYWYYKKRNPIPIMAGHFVINIATVIQIRMTSLSPGLYEQLSNR